MIVTLLLLTSLHLKNCQSIEVPTLEFRSGCEEFAHGAAYEKCSFGDAALTARINHFIDERVRSNAGFGDAKNEKQAASAEECEKGQSSHQNHRYASCSTPYVVSDVISIGCGSSWDGGAHPDAAPFSINLAVEGGKFRELSLRELLVSDEAEKRLWQLVASDVRRQLGELREKEPDIGEDDHQRSFEQIDSECHEIHLTRDGVVAGFDHYSFGHEIVEAKVPYRDLKAILLPKLLPASSKREPGRE